jgi:cytochrome P450
MSARDEATGEGMSDRQLRDEVLTLFVAGHETTALALTWCFYLLAGHPEVEQRLHQELADALGGRTPRAADLPNLPFTRQVIDETLRLYPPAWITNRTALDEDEISGFHIPAGAYVALSPFSTQRHPEYWTDPAAFDPDRFLAERSADRPRYAYFPFGGGPHKCIGEGFALVEAQLILATIAQRYQLRPAGNRPVELEASLTLRPRNGLAMELRPRIPI